MQSPTMLHVRLRSCDKKGVTHEMIRCRAPTYLTNRSARLGRRSTAGLSLEHNKAVQENRE